MADSASHGQRRIRGQTPGRRGRAFALAAALAALVAAARAHALEPGQRFDRYTHVAWPTIAHAAGVHTIVALPDGAMSVGTSEGLVRLEGTRVESFDRRRFPGIVDRNVRAVVHARDGALWIASFGGGLSRVAGGTVTSAPAGQAPGPHLLALLEDADGTIWATGIGGVARIAARTGALVATPTNAGLQTLCTHALARGADGALYLATHHGVARWTGTRWALEAGGAPTTIIDVLRGEPDGTLWAGTRSEGLWRRRGGRWENLTAAPARAVTALLRDRAGRLWVAGIGADGSGTLAWLDGDRFHALALPARLCPEKIRALGEDAEGGLWIGTELCGLHRLSDRPFVTLDSADGLPGDRVLGLARRADGSVLVGTRGSGLARVTSTPPAQPWGEVTRIGCAAGLPCRECWDFSPRVRAEADGGFWAVCQPNVVLRFDGQSVSRRTPLPGDPDAASFALETRDGALWLAHRDRVVRRVGEHATPITGHEHLSGYRILHEDRAGTVWLGADDGLAAWRAGKVDVVPLAARDRPAEIANFHEDAAEAGTLWLATKGEGIRRVRAGHIATVGVAEGLPSGFIVQLLEDGQGRLWASSSKGIFFVDKRALAEVADGRRTRVYPRLYDAGDGVHVGGEPYGHPAGFVAPDGRLWFATNAGIAIIDPEAPAWRVPAPRVRVKELRLGGRVQPADAAAARGAPLDLEVDLLATTFAPAASVAFGYRMAGDAGFTEIGTHPTLQLPRLAAGRYQLALAARHREGDWGPPTQLGFVVRPPFHRSPWFAGLVIAGIGAALLAVHRVRLARTRAELEATMAERARIAREMHDTLAQAFVATSLQLECLADAFESDDLLARSRGHDDGKREGDERDDGGRADRRTQRVQRHLALARRVVAESLEEARAALWVLRPQAVAIGLVPALEALVERLSYDGSSSIGKAPTVALVVSGAQRDLPPLVASNLLRIAQEAVANAHRHAHARRIDLRLAFSARAVTLSVADDGAGIDVARAAATPARANAQLQQGLLGMQERAAQMGARLSIEDAPEQGTTIRVEVAA